MLVKHWNCDDSPCLQECLAASAQQTGQVQLKIEPTNRTLTVSAENRVTVDPDVAILHVGFETQPSDAKAAYAAGAQTSNAIVAALKQAGIPETSIRSEWQRLDSVYGKPHKFTLAQQWTVKVKPERAAEILDVAVTAGATDSGQIDWTVENEQALQDKALDGRCRARTGAGRGAGQGHGREAGRAGLCQQPGFCAGVSDESVCQQCNAHGWMAAPRRRWRLSRARW